jgi:hypothetical protein
MGAGNSKTIFIQSINIIKLVNLDIQFSKIADGVFGF